MKNKYKWKQTSFTPTQDGKGLGCCVHGNGYRFAWNKGVFLNVFPSKNDIF
jgi:hypothetical protein